MTNASLKRVKVNERLIILIPLILIIFSSFFILISSCRPKNNTDNTDEKLESFNSSSDSRTDSIEKSLYLFDYEKIKLEDTSSIGVKIKNCNLYTDIYEDMVIMGEIENVSTVNKTDIEITFNFYNKDGGEIITDTVPALVNYLRAGSRLPFCYYLDEKEKYIEISKVKIGVNYKDYYKRFKGNPIAENEKYYYIYAGNDNYLVIEGRLVNIGDKKVKNLKLLCTFYNSKGRVVFIKKCYLPREEMIPEEEQKFTLKVLLDEYSLYLKYMSIPIDIIIIETKIIIKAKE